MDAVSNSPLSSPSQRVCKLDCCPAKIVDAVVASRSFAVKVPLHAVGISVVWHSRKYTHSSSELHCSSNAKTVATHRAASGCVDRADNADNAVVDV